MPGGERLNVCTHLAGLVLSLAWGAWLLARLDEQGGAHRIAGVVVFSLCCVLLYAASVLFHGTRGRARLLWQRLDHSAIHALIAGSLTPFVLMGGRGIAGWAILGAVWLLAAICIRREWADDASERVSVALYLVLGWSSVMAAVPVAIGLDPVCLWWLLAGAALYSLGALVFYRNPWHLRGTHTGCGTCAWSAVRPATSPRCPGPWPSSSSVERARRCGSRAMNA